MNYSLLGFYNRRAKRNSTNFARESARLLNYILREARGKSYLEIGVESGKTFLKIKADLKFAVDPEFKFNIRDVEGSSKFFFEGTSDAFFDKMLKGTGFPRIFDVVFIDGLHTYDQAKRDLVNCSKFLNEKSIVVVDDTIPIDKYSALDSQIECYEERKRAKVRDDGSWHGSVYKLIYQIARDLTSQLEVFTIQDFANPKTVIWSSSGAWNEIAKELQKDIDLTYADIFGNGIPDEFHPVTYSKFRKVIKAWSRAH
jgi:hypothetical protein